MLDHVKRGDPIKADSFNQLVDAVSDGRNIVGGNASSLTRGRFGASIGGKECIRDLCVCLIRNDSGGALNAFNVVALTDTIYDPTNAAQLYDFKYSAAFAGDIPTDADAGKFAILLEPIANGKYGRAAVAGVVAAKLYVDDTNHNWADVTDSDENFLTTGDAGAAQILWKESGTGEKWGLVRLGAGTGGSAAWINFTTTATWAADTNLYSVTVTKESGGIVDVSDTVDVRNSGYMVSASGTKKGMAIYNAEDAEWQVVHLQGGPTQTVATGAVESGSDLLSDVSIGTGQVVTDITADGTSIISTPIEVVISIDGCDGEGNIDYTTATLTGAKGSPTITKTTKQLTTKSLKLSSDSTVT